MKIEEAYSLDVREVIDAEKAYELYWEGVIKDKRNFECPSPTCVAQITCSNIDRQIEEMKNTPHFRVYGEHSPNCDLNNEAEHRGGEGSTKTGLSLNNYLDPEVDILLIERPKDHFQIRTSAGTENRVDHYEMKKSLTKDGKNTRKRNSKYYTIKPLISKFERYSKENNLSRRYINIKGYNVTYLEMFAKINGKELDELSKYPRIYFGEARVFAKNNSDYVIRFNDLILDKNDEYKPSIYISNKMINEYHGGKNNIRFCLDELKKEKTRKVLFFVYSKPWKKGDYINFYLDTLDLLDFRYL